MASSPVTNIRIDPDLKEQANAVFEELGLTLSTAVNVFLRAVVREGGMPFDMKLARTGDRAMEANRDKWLSTSGIVRLPELQTA